MADLFRLALAEYLTRHPVEKEAECRGINKEETRR